MINSNRLASLSIVFIILLALAAALISPLSASLASAPTHHPSKKPIHHQSHHYLPLTSFHLQGVDGPYHTQGNLILGADNKPFLFHGLGRDSLEFNCWGDGHFDAQELSYMGPGKSTAYATFWGGNTVRLPLSEGFWLNGDPSSNCSPAQYQSLIKQTVDSLTNMNLNVILDLQWTDAGGNVSGGGAQYALPDNDSVTFWQQVAPIYKSYSNVLFEVYNEPYPPNWTCWQQGCQITNDKGYNYTGIGMQTLVNTVRNTGANNLILVAGMDFGFDLSQIPNYPLSGTNLVYDTHPYPYNEKLPPSWNKAFGTLSATYPVISAESGEYDCGTNYMSQLLAYFDAHNISWIGWAWVAFGSNPCGYPQVITSYNGSPATGMGQLIYHQLQSYLALPVSSPGNPQ